MKKIDIVFHILFAIMCDTKINNSNLNGIIWSSSKAYLMQIFIVKVKTLTPPYLCGVV